MEDLSSCIEIINVHDIREFANQYEIKCDYVERVTNRNYTKYFITSYKYFNDYEEMFNHLLQIRNRGRISNDSSEFISMVPLLQRFFSDKTIYIFLVAVFLLLTIENMEDLYIGFMIFLSLFLVIVLAIKGQKKVTNPDDIVNLGEKLIIGQIVV